MTMNSRFHVTDEKYLENSAKMLSKYLESGELTIRDKSLIENYLSEISVTNRISAVRRYKLTVELVKARSFFDVEYSQAGVGDIYAAVGKIINAKNEDGTPRYKKNTQVDRVTAVKRFMLWMVENGYSDVPKKKILAIRPPRKDDLTVTAAQLLTEEEVNRIIQSADNVRDRALISMLYEGAFRAQEIGVLKWRDVDITPNNLRVNTSEKTGKPRFIPLVSSRTYLINWMNEYPKKISPDDFVFVTLDKNMQQMNYTGLVKQIRAATERAGITKHVKPHLFRHSRITHMLQSEVPETVVKMLCWGDVNTNMIKIYGHLQNSDIERTIMSFNGIITDEMKDTEKKRGMKPLQCPKCSVINAPTARYCSKCGSPLTIEGITKHEELAAEILKIISERDVSVLTEAAARVQRGII